MPADKTSALFRPFRVGNLELPNRVVMAPMTRTAAPGGVPNDKNAAYYRRRAESGVGLILSEGTVIDRPASQNHPEVPFFHGEAALAGWKKVIDEVHAAGGRMGPQIWHAGASKSILADWEPEAPMESPSGLFAPGDAQGVAMTEEDIADTVAAFGKAARAARDLGFDMLELHGAHGFLIDQFFWAETNNRKDIFGGATLPERSRFAAEVLKSVRDAVGPGFPISLRISQFKQQDHDFRMATNPDEVGAWLAPLVEASANLTHCSQRRFWEPEFPEVDGSEGLNLAGWVKKLTGASTISVGSVGLDTDVLRAFEGQGAKTASLEKLVERMERDEFDLIAVGRVLISNPDWVTKIRDGNRSELKGFDASDLSVLV